jgi:hypothetical protein
VKGTGKSQEALSGAGSSSTWPQITLKRRLWGEVRQGAKLGGRRSRPCRRQGWRGSGDITGVEEASRASVSLGHDRVLRLLCFWVWNSGPSP